MKICVFLLFLAAFSADPNAWAQKKRGYNMWAKERIRYLYNKVNLDPDDPHLRLLLANAYYENKQNRDAQLQLEKALKLQPRFPEAHCNLGGILQAQGRMPEARHHYKESLRYDSTMVEALSGLGTLLCRTDQEGEGLAYLERVLELEPDLANARFNIAVAYHKGGNYNKAIEHLNILLSQNANYAGTQQALAQAYYSQGLIYLLAQKPQEALVVFAHSRQQGNNDENIAFATGLAHMYLENYTGAETEFKKAIELEPDHVPALHNLASIYERQERMSEAEHYYQLVHQLTPYLGSIEAAKHAKYDVEYLVK